MTHSPLRYTLTLAGAAIIAETLTGCADNTAEQIAQWCPDIISTLDSAQYALDSGEPERIADAGYASATDLYLFAERLRDIAPGESSTLQTTAHTLTLEAFRAVVGDFPTRTTGADWSSWSDIVRRDCTGWIAISNSQ